MTSLDGDRVVPGPRDGRYEYILSTAADLIHERGYQAVSMRDLAQAVGVKMPSLYHHFESKEQILYAIARRTMIALIERTVAVVDVLDESAVRERLAAAIRISVRFHVERQADAGAVLSEARQLAGEYFEEVRRLMKDYEAIFYGLITDGIESGAFARRDPTMATYLVLSALTRISIWYRPNGRLTLDAVEDEYTALLLAMLQPQGAQAPPSSARSGRARRAATEA